MNTPEIVTERLILRKFTANDPDALKHNNIPVGYVKADLDDSHDSGDGLCKEFRHKGIDVNNIRSGNVMKRLGMNYRYSYILTGMRRESENRFPALFFCPEMQSCLQNVAGDAGDGFRR